MGGGGMTTAREFGERYLTDLADSTLVATVRRLADADAARWVFDPDVPDVVGLVLPGTRTALVIVYLPGETVWGEQRTDADFEVDHEALLRASRPTG